MLWLDNFQGAVRSRDESNLVFEARRIHSEKSREDQCPKCHSENPADTRFCSNCGAKLSPPEEISVSHTETLQVPLKELTTGSTFAGRYQVIEELGKGGMGKVYKNSNLLFVIAINPSQ